MGKTLASPPLIIVQALAFLWVLNFVAGRYFGFPFAYCWMGGPVSELYMTWGVIALYVLIALTAFNLLRGRMMEAIFFALAVTVVIEMPRLFSYLFYSGGSCG